MPGKRPVASFPSVQTTPKYYYVDSCVKDITIDLTDIGKAYDADFKCLTEDLSDLDDTVVAVNNHRLERINELKSDIANWQHAVAVALKSAQGIKSLQTYREETALLELEKANLSASIAAGMEENEHLSAQLNRIKRKLQKVHQAYDAIKYQAELDLPSLQYLRKVLFRVSKTKICSNSGSTFIEGFIVKDEQNDVRPFSFDDKRPVSSKYRFDDVNSLWKIICE